MPLVVKLKIRLPEMAASVITRKSRAITAWGSVHLLLGLAGGRHLLARDDEGEEDAAQRGRCRAGTAKAVRQPKCLTRKPVRIGRDRDAQIAREAVDSDGETRLASTFCTIMGMPTG